MKSAKILCWIENTKKDEMEISDGDCIAPRDKVDERKQAKWNPGLSIGAKTCRAVGRRKKKWEDEVNQILKPEDTDETNGNDIKNNGAWIWAAKDQETWKNGRRILQQQAK